MAKLEREDDNIIVVLNKTETKCSINRKNGERLELDSQGRLVRIILPGANEMLQDLK